MFGPLAGYQIAPVRHLKKQIRLEEFHFGPAERPLGPERQLEHHVSAVAAGGCLGFRQSGPTQRSCQSLAKLLGPVVTECQIHIVQFQSLRQTE